MLHRGLASLCRSLLLTVEQVGINRGREDKYQGDAQEQERVPQEGSNHNDRTAGCPYPAAEAMGLVPVFFVVQGPGELNADGVALLALGQVVSDVEEHAAQQQAHKCWGAQEGVIAQGGGVNQSRHQRGHRWADPQHQIQDLGALSVGFGIGGSTQDADPMHCFQEQGQSEYGECLAAPSVDLAVSIPMGGDFLRELVP